MTPQMQRAKLWAKVVLVLLLLSLFLTFLLLNRNAVVEPRVHLIFFTYERPGLLLVLLLTALSGALLATLLRVIPQWLRHARQNRANARMAGMEDEIAKLKGEHGRTTTAAPSGDSPVTNQH